MRILQLTGDWKWTGPAAPLLELLLAQRARGHRVDLACPAPPPGQGPGLLERAREAGVEPALELARARGVIWWRDGEDARRLRLLVRREDYDVLHAWHTRDHVLAVRAAGERRADGRTRVVRSLASAEPLRPWAGTRWLFGAATDGLLCVSEAAARANRPLRRGRPILASFGAVRLDRFRPGAPPPGLRASLGLAPEHRVVGIAARVQRRRRFDLLLEAARVLFRRDPRARLLVLGRGTHYESALRAPARRLGIAERVVFAGHRRADYADALRACDLFTLLVPGSDGSCRAVLEAAACGLPAVVTRRGALPEIVAHGETGLVVDEDPAALAGAWAELLADPARSRRLGAAARRRAERHFAPEALARRVEGLYRGRIPQPVRDAPRP